MSRIADGKRRRHEYLQRKGEAYASITASGGLVLFSLALLVFGLNVLLRSRVEPVDSLIVVLFAAALFGGCARGIWWGIRDIRAILRGARRIPYEPPVTDVGPLAPEDVLVRAAAEPGKSASETLLRTVQSKVQGDDTAQEQLLRVRDV